MRNLKSEVRRIVQEEMNTYNTSRMLVTEIGDGSAKPYKFTRFNAHLARHDGSKTTFKTDSKLLYVVYLENREMYLDVTFKANDTFDVTNRGEMYKVMSTLIAIIEQVFKKTELKGIRYSPYEKGNDGGRGRDTLYRLFISSFAKKHGLKVEFDGQGAATVFAHLEDPTGKFLLVPLREKLLNPKRYKITKKDLTVKDDLDLSNTNIMSLPRGLKVSKDLILKSCTSLTSLPDGLQAGWSLYLNGCTSLKALPNGLKVGGDLYLNDCTSLMALPDGLSVEWDLTLSNTPLAEIYSKDEIKSMVEAKGGYVDGNIFV